MKKLILAIFLLFLFPVLAFAATTNKAVTKLTWTNSFTAAENVTSILFTCGSVTYSDTASTDIVAGATPTLPLSTVLTADGTYTCTAEAINANGASAPSNSTAAITLASGVFTIAVTVPDPITGLGVE